MNPINTMTGAFEDPSALQSQGGHVKSSELASVRGVSAVVVSLRAAILLSHAKREFIWYLQGLSLKDGGFRRVARELVAMFPERLGSPEMHKAGIAHDTMCPGELARSIKWALGDWSVSEDSHGKLKGCCGSELIQRCRDLALLARTPNQNSTFGASWKIPTIEEFLIELCTNPKALFSLPGVDKCADELERERYQEEHPELGESDFTTGSLIYFRDIIEALQEYRSRHEKKLREVFHMTAIGAKIREALDFALAGRKMVVLEGLEGRGKTEAVKAWCELHPGRARLVSLKGVSTRTAVFREISIALGITCAYGRTGAEMQARIEDVLNRSKLMLVIDEAHFLFSQARHVTARPELIDWIDTAVCNRSVPIALVTTPQFITCMARAKNQVQWNYNQFRRRLKWIALPPKNTDSDIAAVARSVFKNSSESVIKKIVGYSLVSKRDLSAVGDVAAEVRVMLGTDDLINVPIEPVAQAIEFLITSDQAFKVSLAAAESEQRKSRRPSPELTLERPDEAGAVEASAHAGAGAAPDEEPVPNRGHGRVIMPASRSVAPAAGRGGLDALLTAS